MPPRVRARTKTVKPKPSELQVAADIYKFRNQGMSLEHIALQLGMSPRKIKEIFDRVLNDNVAGSLEEYINTEVAHLYELTEAVMPHVLAGSTEHVESALKIADMRSRLLGVHHLMKNGAMGPGSGGGPSGAIEGAGTLIELHAGGDEPGQYEAALQAAHESVESRRPG